MRILAMDTSTWWGGVALVERTEEAGPCVLVAELGVQINASHAPSLLESIERLLALAGWDRSSVDAYAATRGPGSFTGVRVGLGTIRGLSLATDRPCAGVCTLDAVAEAHGPAAVERIALIGAGRGELFGARYDASSSPVVPLEEPWLGPPARVAASVGEGGAVAIPAPGTDSVARAVRPDAPGLRFVVAPRSIAAAAGRLVLQRGELDPDKSASLSPLYLRPPDAELKVPTS
jgi:tRNA threonylcarbamoyladenosine biosynthesis protein TsaB